MAVPALPWRQQFLHILHYVSLSQKSASIEESSPSPSGSPVARPSSTASLRQSHCWLTGGSALLLWESSKLLPSFSSISRALCRETWWPFKPRNSANSQPMVRSPLLSLWHRAAKLHPAVEAPTSQAQELTNPRKSLGCSLVGCGFAVAASRIFCTQYRPLLNSYVKVGFLPLRKLLSRVKS